MGRLESQAKMGFYPTPSAVVEHIRNMLNISHDARLLDTCCGEGEALALVAGDTRAEAYGVELNRQRMKMARTG